MQQILVWLFEEYFKEKVESFTPMAVHASSRKLYRIKSKTNSSIGVDYSNRAENAAFISFSRHFRKCGLPVPAIYKVSDEGFHYIHEDLGQETLFERLTKERQQGKFFSPEVERLYAEALEHLSYFQIEGLQGLDIKLSTTGEAFDRKAMQFDCTRFKKEFLARIQFAYSESLLQQEFSLLIDYLEHVPSHFFMYRDFQSRNIMLRGEKTWFIDYQGGLRGALYYDVASLLYQTQAQIPEDARERLVAVYLTHIASRVKVEKQQFLEHLDAFVLIRLLQVLGAYGKLGIGDKKTYFLQGIPLAVQSVCDILKSARLPIHLPLIKGIFSELSERRSFSN